jgi:hypothetical protein
VASLKDSPYRKGLEGSNNNNKASNIVLILTFGETSMSKKKPLCKQSVAVKRKKSEFKPGNKPYLEYDGCVLNANVPWNELLSDLVASGFSHEAIATEIGTELQILSAIEAKDFENLSFRAGARMITMHSEARPENYLDF